LPIAGLARRVRSRQMPRGRMGMSTHRAIVMQNGAMSEEKPFEHQSFEHQSLELPGYDMVLRVVPMPADLNANGDVFGGWVMAQVDIAGSLPAVKRAKGRVATVAVNNFLFRQPISVGDLVSFYAKVQSTGRTSVTVHVVVIAERKPAAPVCVKVTEASLTYVAIDELGQKRALP
jgi:acyl-CoA thioesterase YciA